MKSDYIDSESREYAANDSTNLWTRPFESSELRFQKGYQLFGQRKANNHLEIEFEIGEGNPRNT